MSSAFDYDDVLGGYVMPNSGYESVGPGKGGVAVAGSRGGSGVGGGGVGGGGAKEAKPKIILMGLRRSGKTSISSVVFAKLSPSESLFLESTTRVYKVKRENVL